MCYRLGTARVVEGSPALRADDAPTGAARFRLAQLGYGTRLTRTFSFSPFLILSRIRATQQKNNHACTEIDQNTHSLVG